LEWPNFAPRALSCIRRQLARGLISTEIGS
jgi:hypothetical protein